METIEYLEALRMPTTSEEIEEMDTVHSGHCCNCKYDDGHTKVWICRVENGVTVEQLIRGAWHTVAGGCMDVLY